MMLTCTRTAAIAVIALAKPTHTVGSSLTEQSKLATEDTLLRSFATRTRRRLNIADTIAGGVASLGKGILDFFKGPEIFDPIDVPDDLLTPEELARELKANVDLAHEHRYADTNYSGFFDHLYQITRKQSDLSNQNFQMIQQNANALESKIGKDDIEMIMNLLVDTEELDRIDREGKTLTEHLMQTFKEADNDLMNKLVGDVTDEQLLEAGASTKEEYLRKMLEKSKDELETVANTLQSVKAEVDTNTKNLKDLMNNFDMTDKLEGETHSDYFLRKMNEEDAKLFEGLDIPDHKNPGQYIKELIEDNTREIEYLADKVQINADNIAKLNGEMTAVHDAAKAAVKAAADNVENISDNEAALENIKTLLGDESLMEGRGHNQSVLDYFMEKIRSSDAAAEEFSKKILGENFDHGDKPVAEYLQELINENSVKITQMGEDMAAHKLALDNLQTLLGDESVMEGRGHGESVLDYLIKKINTGDAEFERKMLGNNFDQTKLKGQTVTGYLEDLIRGNSEQIEAMDNAIETNRLALENLENLLGDERLMEGREDGESVLEYLLDEIKSSDGAIREEILGENFDTSKLEGKSAIEYLESLISDNADRITDMGDAIAANKLALNNLKTFLGDERVMEGRKHNESVLDYLLGKIQSNDTEAEEFSKKILGDNFDCGDKPVAQYLKELINENKDNITKMEQDIADNKAALENLKTLLGDESAMEGREHGETVLDYLLRQLDESDSNLKEQNTALKKSLTELMTAENASLKAEFIAGDAETKLAVLKVMHEENAALREQFLAGDAEIIDMVRRGDNEIVEKFNDMIAEHKREVERKFEDVQENVEEATEDLVAMDKELAANDIKLKDDFEEGFDDLQKEFSNEFEDIEDKMAEIKSDLKDVEHANDIQAALGERVADNTEQHVNIDIDMGSMGYGHQKDNDIVQALDTFLQFEWWHCLVIVMALALVLFIWCKWSRIGVEAPLGQGSHGLY